MRRKVLLKEVAKAIVAILVFVAIVEFLITFAYFIRNATVAYVPLPYVIGHSYGPVPPWLDGLRILQPDAALIWRNQPNVYRRYIDIFSPVHVEEDRTSLLRRFFPALPPR